MYFDKVLDPVFIGVDILDNAAYYVIQPACMFALLNYWGAFRIGLPIFLKEYFPPTVQC
jgi:hypothetical protein